MPINVHVHLHGPLDREGEILGHLVEIRAGLVRLEKMERRQMRTLDETLASVQGQSTQIDSLVAYNAGLRQQLADIISGALPPDVQAKVDQLFDAVEQNATKLAAALNTDNAGQPVPVGDSTVPPPVSG
ncbi:hypothetical protein V1288_003786 [Bradyrhizobium sp. AZCC 2176]